MAAPERGQTEERQRVAERRRIEQEDFLPDEGPAFDREEHDEDDEDQDVGSLQALLADRRKIYTWLLLIVLIVVAIYLVFPKIVGADEAVDNLGNAVWYWIVIAVGFNVLAFAAYVALFRGVLGGTRDD